MVCGILQISAKVEQAKPWRLLTRARGIAMSALSSNIVITKHHSLIGYFRYFVAHTMTIGPPRCARWDPVGYHGGS